MKKLFVVSVTLLLCYSITLATPVRAAVCGEDIPKDEGALRTYVEDCSTKLSQLSGQKQTLSQALAVLNTQIKLTEAKIAARNQEIAKLEIEITDLSGKIESLDYSLTDLTRLFIERVRESYMRHSSFPTIFIAQSSGIPAVLQAGQYMQKVRDHDRQLLLALEKSRLDFDTEKTTKETRQTEIEALKLALDKEKAALAGQVAAKNQLLAETKNSESQYQKLLQQAQAELVAIRGIIAGLGKEVKVRDVGEGERIAGIIQGASPCSTGTHLHFEVAQNSNRRNPFELLKNTGLQWDNSDPTQNGSGSWNWPLHDPIRVTQGYGHTAYSSRYTGDVHTGIDMVSDNSTVKAVKPGELFQGSMKCGSGNLVYVHVKQSDNFDTYYLHVNY